MILKTEAPIPVVNIGATPLYEKLVSIRVYNWLSEIKLSTEVTANQ
jgi:hypothetical protein